MSVRSCGRDYCGHPVSSHRRMIYGGGCIACPCPSAIPSSESKTLDGNESKHGNSLMAARIIRDRVAFDRGEVDADMVREVFEARHGSGSWGPWAGALFRDKRYEPTGEFRPSRFAKNHGAVIRVWRMKRVG